jgi:tRNA-splicing ligase RtcB (3'-phosphate/5'-hydroxy nucleic acid ligase)
MPLMQPAGKNCYRIERQGRMKADVLVYLNEELYKNFSEDQSLQQLMDAASLEGVISPVIGMPDIHSGFGLPIGGVMAMDESRGLISAGAVGYDINCGVRLLSTAIEKSGIDKKLLRSMVRAIGKRIPSGIGHKSEHAEQVQKHFRSLVEKGVPYLVELGYGRAEDLDCIEEGGFMSDADMGAVSSKAAGRGAQLSTIGGGNHFIELGYVEQIYDNETAAIYGLKADTLTVLIHTGSRGFGHQICTDYSQEMKKAASRYRLDIPNSGLAAVPIDSDEGKRYYTAMACAINFAFCNRQWITDDVRRAFKAVLGNSDKRCELDLVYDVAHNTARFEKISGRKVLLHRKGATRALPPGHESNPQRYSSTGHPVLVPGSMGTASYVIRALPKVEEIFYSVNHGAGRVLSRTAAKREISVKELQERIKDVIVSGQNYEAYLDEAPQAYKDIDLVVETLTEIGMSSKVARLLPLAVIKGGSD